MVLPVVVLYTSGEVALERDFNDLITTWELREILAVEIPSAHAWQLELIHDGQMLPKMTVLAEILPPGQPILELQLVRRAGQEYTPRRFRTEDDAPKVTLIFYGVAFHALSQFLLSVKRSSRQTRIHSGGHECLVIEFLRADQRRLRLDLRHVLPTQERRMWPELFKDAFGILLPFSLHYRASLDDAVASMRQLDSLEITDNRVLLGTHLHLHGKTREVSSDEALQLAHSHAYSYHEVFSNSLRSIEEMIFSLLDVYLDKSPVQVAGDD